MIPLSVVRLGEAEEALLLEVARSGRLAQGPMVARLEDEFREHCGCAHVVAVANGTLALVAALEALGLQPGDEVVTTPFTFIATVNAALHLGARVRFADIRLDDFCLDPEALAASVSERTRVILPVHLYGQVADMEPILAIARETGATVLEDAAQAHGASSGGRPAGSFGAAAMFSLYATKNVMAGEGGLISTNDAELAGRLRVLRNQGMEGRYDYRAVGYNWRMTELQAAVAIPQLASLRDRNRRRAANAACLTEGLAGIPGLATPTVREGRVHAWHQYTVRITEGARLDRAGLQEALSARGVETGVYYPKAVAGYDLYRDHPSVDGAPMPNAERAAREVLSLPVHPFLEPKDLDTIVAAVREALGA